MITFNTNKIKPHFEKNKTKNTTSPFTILINSYDNYCDCNMFNDLRCPCCNKKNTLSFHKKYPRNFSYIENGVKIDTVIYITVLECKYCKKCNNKQKYHALLPIFILPYHIYEASMIIDSIYSYLVKEQKLNEILEKIQITHKLFYDWLKKIKIYLLPSSVILKENNVLITIIKKIYLLNEKFLIDFYDNYGHPYFLFKETCVPLCITP